MYDKTHGPDAPIHIAKALERHLGKEGLSSVLPKFGKRNLGCRIACVQVYYLLIMS